MLVENVSADFINWNHKITAVRESQNVVTGVTEFTLEFGDNGTETFDFVVGADGAWSRVRRLITDVKPFYSGAQWLTATLRRVNPISAISGAGGVRMFVALGGGRDILSHRGPQDSIRVYATIGSPDEHWIRTAGLEGKTTAEAKIILLNDNTIFGK